MGRTMSILGGRLQRRLSLTYLLLALIVLWEQPGLTPPGSSRGGWSMP